MVWPSLALLLLPILPQPQEAIPQILLTQAAGAMLPTVLPLPLPLCLPVPLLRLQLPSVPVLQQHLHSQAALHTSGIKMVWPLVVLHRLLIQLLQQEPIRQIFYQVPVKEPPLTALLLL